MRGEARVARWHTAKLRVGVVRERERVLGAGEVIFKEVGLQPNRHRRMLVIGRDRQVVKVC